MLRPDETELVPPVRTFPNRRDDLRVVRSALDMECGGLDTAFDGAA
jgi:hypothetical protein